jgi:hypothetical protein
MKGNTKMSMVLPSDIEGNFYDYLADMDIIGKLRPILERKGYHVRPDGRIDKQVPGLAWDSPWVHFYQDHINMCDIAHGIIFAHFGWIPTYCQNCWKVVVRPRTLSELFALCEIQREMHRPSKCGIELRATVNGNYGGYFYNKGKPAGEECWREVRKIVDLKIGRDVAVILKCACTEFEMENGPPADYEPSSKQLRMEALLDKWIASDSRTYVQPEYAVAFIMRKWIHHAYSIGDSTYAEYTGRKPLSRAYKTYHEELTKES